MSISVGLVAIFLQLPQESWVWLTLPGHITWLLVFCFWQRLRSFVTQPTMVFMDKICIAQHDDNLKDWGGSTETSCQWSFEAARACL